MTESRRFMTRVEATYALGLACASQPIKPLVPVRLALRDKKTGTVYEATDDERVHAQIACRIKLNAWEEGWTVDPADLRAHAKGHTA